LYPSTTEEEMQNNDDTPAPSSDLENSEVETKSVSKKPQGAQTDQNPDHV
jgi:hypothetical protein